MRNNVNHISSQANKDQPHKNTKYTATIDTNKQRLLEQRKEAKEKAKKNIPTTTENNSK